jgi:hypothetical protein
MIGPASVVAPVTPDDSGDLPGGVARGLYVGVGGTLSLVDASGAAFELISGDAQYHPIRIRAVRASGTTASSVLALY